MVVSSWGSVDHEILTNNVGYHEMPPPRALYCTAWSREIWLADGQALEKEVVLVCIMLYAVL